MIEDILGKMSLMLHWNKVTYDLGHIFFFGKVIYNLEQMEYYTILYVNLHTRYCLNFFSFYTWVKLISFDKLLALTS